MKQVKKRYVTIAALAVTMLVALSMSSNTAYAAQQGWDLVDSGKHLDWDSNTKYLSNVKTGIGLWEGHRSGVIRPDSALVIEDVFISDYNEVSTTMGVTSSAGTIKFNDYNFGSMSSSERTKTVTHEIGHALGLDHTWGSSDIMQQGQLSITSLSKTDKSSYDEAYATY